ncbi:MAG: radical SAM protein [Thermotaleaceae bacterium]
MEYISAKTIVTKTKNTQWFGTDYNMNIYKGCSHGCIYCDSRSECYGIYDFDRVRAKENALQIIRDELRKKVKTGVIGTGAMSDPYNPFEKKMLLTRHALELVNAFEFGVAIATKSDLITRDVDVLTDIKRHSPLIVKMTVTTWEDKLCKIIEPNVALTKERFAALKCLSDKEIFSGILLMPVLPFIEDSQDNVLKIVRLARENGARFIYPAFGVTLRQNQRVHYYQKLDEHFPGIKDKYIKKYGSSYRCASPRARELWSLFQSECDRLGLLYKMQDIIKAYKMGYKDRQLSFF